ncbi:MAG TPA: DUF2950 family protein [Candidatus Dormibacteraeota bacterium]|nr:DUF2950 family protein [Candidatus Dormibacteraeota bacterium]
MRTNNMKLEAFTVRLAVGFTSTVLLLLLVGLLLAVAGFAGSSFAQDTQRKTFSSPVEASDALFQAAQKEDELSLEAILGAGKEVTSSNDEVEDKLEREQFSKKYQEMHRLVQEADGTTVLYIGAENWPFPVPLVSKNGAWYFDSETGTQEILFRRIGENEDVAIQVCEEFALAKKEQGAEPASYDPVTQFARNLVSAGTTNAGNNGSSPFHGYYFRLVSRNSAAATSRYASIGDKKAGLALVAYPVEYRSSGVKTFIVAKDGVVYEKDLGSETATAASTISSRPHDWRPAE